MHREVGRVADVVRHGALEGRLLAVRHGAVGDAAGMIVQQVRPGAMAQLSGARDGAVLAAALGAFDVPVDLPLSRCSDGDGVRLLWNGPGRFLVSSRRHCDAELSDELGTALADTGAVAVDVSHARTVLRVRGPACRDVLAKGCPLDVDGLRAGDCAATVVSHFNVLVHCDGPDSFDLYVTRSLALAFFEWLLHAGMEYGVEVSPVTP